MTISRNQLKTFAIICMTIQHCLFMFGTDKSPVYLTYLTSVGSIVPIIMGFFLVEGYIYTSDKKKYFKRLLITGLITQLPYDIFALFCDRFTVRYPISLNIMLTFAICFVGLAVYDLEINKWIKTIIIGALFLFFLPFASYYLLLPIMTLGLLHCRRENKNPVFVYVVAFASYYILLIVEYYLKPTSIALWLNLLLNILVMTLTAFALERLYTSTYQKTGKFSKWFFYIYYPLHMLILTLIMLLIVSR